ncbi:Uncharacterized membrane protein, DUF485 family [Marininema mesophilum]|uniref:Uncharacterized membrane protein, DUF485 family n=1 Tax=Marininema mesophilum TaxID=1048340 RepID=A0A1H2ZKG6_9BACL|nr:DUF485 domain-containing protein [Marininema mesophilum]SDX17896.1 Uncharacterized membrane protein, DUF485 family [Marininema mesophilum]
MINQNESDYKKIVRSPLFQELLQKKRKFIIPTTIFFFVFYFSLPVLTSYTTVLNKSAIGPISWAWVFAFAQFAMTWGLCLLYSSKAKTFDTIVEQIKKVGGEDK